VEPLTVAEPGPLCDAEMAKLEIPIERMSFERWLQIPMSTPCADPRFEVRRAGIQELESVYDLIDAAFESKRPRRVYDWLYRQSPAGPAHVWITVERATAKIVSARAEFPWPIAVGTRLLNGYVTGDAGVLQRWRRQGIRELVRAPVESVAGSEGGFGFGWPNQRNIGQDAKHGRSFRLLAFPTAKLKLDAKLFGAVRIRLEAASRAISSRLRGNLPVREVSRFDSAFDPVTRRCMGWRGYWCPHDWAFLNWRYIDHPGFEYRAFAACEGDDPVGYCVVKLGGRRATLMEFTAPADADAVRKALLERAVATARAAGCRNLRLFAPPTWRHWGFLEASGFAKMESLRYFNPRIKAPTQGCNRAEVWQVLPGDLDAE